MSNLSMMADLHFRGCLRNRSKQNKKQTEIEGDTPTQADTESASHNMPGSVAKRGRECDGASNNTEIQTVQVVQNKENEPTSARNERMNNNRWPWSSDAGEGRSSASGALQARRDTRAHHPELKACSGTATRRRSEEAQPHGGVVQRLALAGAGCRAPLAFPQVSLSSFCQGRQLSSQHLSPWTHRCLRSSTTCNADPVFPWLRPSPRTEVPRPARGPWRHRSRVRPPTTRTPMLPRSEALKPKSASRGGSLQGHRRTGWVGW